MAAHSFLTVEEIKKIGFKKFGENLKISRFATFYAPHKMELGNNIRIDDFCIFSGSIKIGNYVHISAFSALYGGSGITIDDFSGISPRCTVLSVSDDFSGECMIGPMIPEEYRNAISAPVILKKYVQLGAGSIILPGVTIDEGTVTGAMSLVTKNLTAWKICFGIPAKEIKERKKCLLNNIPKLIND